ncbi:hypothetical protein [Halotia branconii]|uniref:Uncharacterized protein n=1 Tax=Halotia branconii CENA392 TaxID=1539056 RepID=A0AAJ6NS90_9CYAN|nr:hypothetical protein [Halotia branconii]WGV23474.1 hypothetical protein QI031_16750 [Halotia branconii CENA392]WGV25667.1 hypothetical protein QI031_28770 [Halotia branconii CENA392]WGV25925.1 hypothetical protein QI031_30175 [Halotia branconii CENA392]
MTTALSYSALAEKLPAGSIEFVGNNQVKLNFSTTTESGSNLTLNASCVKGIVKLLQGLAALTDQVNEARVNAELPPIQFASQQLTGTPEMPEYEFTVRVKVDTAQFIENLDDPTD